MAKRLVGQDEVDAAFRRALALHGSTRKLAAAAKVSHSYIGDVASGRRPVAPALAEWLGYRLVKRWERVAPLKEAADGSR